VRKTIISENKMAVLSRELSFNEMLDTVVEPSIYRKTPVFDFLPLWLSLNKVFSPVDNSFSKSPIWGIIMVLESSSS
jgi:hypothetical protein